MKKIIFSFYCLAMMLMACNNNSETKTSTSSGSTIKMPYEPGYSADFNNNVSDSLVLLVLNSYKHWEAADMKALRSTMGDSMVVDGSDGFKFSGLADSLMPRWQGSRDSMSSVVITMDAWVKSHSLKDSVDYVTVWYKEIDTYKSGRVDSANYADVNGLMKGKITWFSSYRQNLKQ
ncbi:MAG TPA: hypothetical protein VK489_06470 [Ferruginibacter sp.]|nr:hypothetical protein [Ferruginibacter sp.]